MKFEQLFDQRNGNYVADGFSEGVCFAVIEGTLYLKIYSSPDDLTPSIECIGMTKSYLHKEYRKVLTVKSLFKNK